MNNFAITQGGASYTELLEKGIRYFDLRFRKQDGGKLDQYQLYHGPVFLHSNLKEAIDEIRDFLQKNPSEIVFVQLQPEHGDENERILGAHEIRDTLYKPYRQSKHFSNELTVLANELPGYNGTATNLFVEGYKDFDDIRLLRKYRGLGNLGKDFKLADFNLQNGGYSEDSKILDPKHSSDNSSAAKLNYHGLTLGDVRGRIIPVGNELKGFPGHGFDDAELNVVLLGPSEYSSGIIMQNNFAPEGGSHEKLDTIFAFAKSYLEDSSMAKDKQLPMNWTSIAGKLSTTPTDYAIDINDGELGRSLASWLNINLDPTVEDGIITKSNYNQKLIGNPGLRGVMIGDFYTLASSFYAEAKERLPGEMDARYFHEYSDWLLQKIWRQSALVAPIVRSPHVDKITKIGDTITGTELPKVFEGQPFVIQWQDYLGRGKINQFRVRHISYKDLGLDTTADRVTGDRSSTLFSRQGGRTKKSLSSTYNEKDNYLTRLIPEKSEGYNVPVVEGVQGDRFFKIEAIYEDNTIGSPVFFMVSDLK